MSFKRIAISYLIMCNITLQTLKRNIKSTILNLNSGLEVVNLQEWIVIAK